MKSFKDHLTESTLAATTVFKKVAPDPRDRGRVSYNIVHGGSVIGQITKSDTYDGFTGFSVARADAGWKTEFRYKGHNINRTSIYLKDFKQSIAFLLSKIDSDPNYIPSKY